MGLTQVNTSSHLGQSYHMGRNTFIFLFMKSKEQILQECVSSY